MLRGTQDFGILASEGIEEDNRLVEVQMDAWRRR